MINKTLKIIIPNGINISSVNSIESTLSETKSIAINLNQFALLIMQTKITMGSKFIIVSQKVKTNHQYISSSGKVKVKE